LKKVLKSASTHDRAAVVMNKR